MQVKQEELISLTDELQSCQADAAQLRKQVASLGGELAAAQATVTQQAAAAGAIQEARGKLQVSPVGLRVGACMHVYAVLAAQCVACDCCVPTHACSTRNLLLEGPMPALP